MAQQANGILTENGTTYCMYCTDKNNYTGRKIEVELTGEIPAFSEIDDEFFCSDCGEPLIESLP